MGFFVVAGPHVLPWAALSDEQEAWNRHWMAGSLACSHRPIPLGPYGVCGVCVCVCVRLVLPCLLARSLGLLLQCLMARSLGLSLLCLMAGIFGHGIIAPYTCKALWALSLFVDAGLQ